MKDLECPYCNAELEVCHDDGEIYNEGVMHEMECSKCEKSFVFTTNISFSFTPQKADCLNNGKHEYQLTHTIPREFCKMRCTMCDHEREMTEAERIESGIGTKEEYFEAQRRDWKINTP